MLKCKQVEHYDNFEDEVIFWVEVENPPEEIKEKAKQIDKENYLDSCFGVCVNFEIENNEFHVVTDWDGNLYYVDNNGEKHWFEVEMSEEFKNELFEMCKSELDK